MANDEPDSAAIAAAALRIADPEARAGYLDRACAGRPELRRSVDARLAERATETVAVPPDSTHAYQPGEDSDRTLTAPAPSMPTADGEPDTTKNHDGPAAPDGPRPGRDIGTVVAGRYTLVELIGEGGMGSVYKADQTDPVRRTVALKLIKRGMDSKAVLARFDAERQALAIMDHPNIARVFDGGRTADGQPFFVMEFVRGETITQYCDRLRLPVRDRLTLFVAVCRAVQHAHLKGIIHRDLKPGNVLVTEVDGRPTPKVIDFGVAKAIEQNLTDLSLADDGVIVGTPAYMSPEQADPTLADIDTRTDVYALGVILYELLVGTTPLEPRQFRRGAILEMLRMVREVDPPRPSTKLSSSDAMPSVAANRAIEPHRLTALLRGELDWVVMKAIEKDRSRRYDTVTGLARDLERYLADETVEARPPSAGYRLRKFVRRNRGPVFAAGLVAAALVAGFVGTALGLFEANRQKDSAIKGWGKAEEEQKRAEQNFATARALVLDIGKQIHQIETGQANPRVADAARKKALDQAREQFEKFNAERPDDESVQRQTAELHRFAANVSRLLFDVPEATKAYAASIQIYERLAERFPDKPRYKDLLAQTLADRAALEKRVGKLKDADATLVLAVREIEGLQGRLDEVDYRRTLGVILDNRTDVVYRLGRFDEMAILARRSGDQFDRIITFPAFERVPTDPLFNAITAHRLALARREHRQIPDALAAHETALARIAALAGPDANRDVRYWECEIRRERTRTARLAADRRVNPEVELPDVITIIEKICADNPHIAHFLEGLAAARLEYGEVLTQSNRADAATAELTVSLAVSRDVHQRFVNLSSNLLIRGRTFHAMGHARAAAGKPDEAVKNWKNAVAVFDVAIRLDPDNALHRRGRAEAIRAITPPAK
jgi:serine/threonine protein kinase/tetratricopeptide (TPR) repeat protein